MKILLVDDEKYSIEGLTNILNWKAFDGELIGTAGNGLEALNIIQTNQPDVIISDIKMPYMDGLQLAEKVYCTYKHITFILLSGHGEFEYAQQAIQFGVKNYLLKPITREKITKLENMLISLNEFKKKKKTTYLQTWDSSLKESILVAFSECNRGFFDELFHSDFFRDSMVIETYNAVGIQLIHYVYEYLMRIQINQDILDKSLKKDIENYYDLPNKEEKVNYIITKYYDILMLTNSQMHSNVDSIANVAKKYADKHYTSPDFNISYLADKLNLSLSYLSTVFKQIAGVNLSTYIIDKRLEHAKALLPDLQYSIGDVASLSGYEDSKYFAKLFKKKVNMTPSEYRNLCIHNNKS